MVTVPSSVGPDITSPRPQSSSYEGLSVPPLLPLACPSASPRPSPYPLPPAGLLAPLPHSAVYKPRKEGLKTTKFTVSAQPLPEESFNLCRGGAHTAALKPGPPGACLSTCLTRWPVMPTGWTPDSGLPSTSTAYSDTSGHVTPSPTPCLQEEILTIPSTSPVFTYLQKALYLTYSAWLPIASGSWGSHVSDM